MSQSPVGFTDQLGLFVIRIHPAVSPGLVNKGAVCQGTTLRRLRSEMIAATGLWQPGCGNKVARNKKGQTSPCGCDLAYVISVCIQLVCKDRLFRLAFVPPSIRHADDACGGDPGGRPVRDYSFGLRRIYL